MNNKLRITTLVAATVSMLSASTIASFAVDDATTPATAATTDKDKDSAPAPKIIFKPGQALETTTDTEDIVATWDVDLAKKQVGAFPDSPEASFILAVALTRTSRVEEALKEVQRARRLAGSKGGPTYFDKMIESYEKMLTGYPDDNKVRYGLAWAYYMKAYLLGQHSRRIAQYKANVAATEAAAKAKAAATTDGATAAGATTASDNKIDNKQVVQALTSGNAGNFAALAGAAVSSIASGQPATNLPHIPTALERVDPADVPQIKSYYDKAIGKIDEILKRNPNDIWTIVYGAHLRAEYSGDLEASMKVWKAVAAKNPNNPAPFFFLGEGYLKQGNLRESINNVSKAIALRALGN